MTQPALTPSRLTEADRDRFAGQAADAAAMLKLLSHEGRLMVLCHLAVAGEMAAGTLTQVCGLSQSALSQHLARLREQGLVATRREGQSIHYRIADARAARILDTLKDVFCP